MTKQKRLSESSWRSRYENCFTLGWGTALATAITFFPPAAIAQTPPPSSPQSSGSPTPGQVILTGEAGQYTGKILVNSSLETVWEVLTDYDNFEQFLPYLKDSRVIATEGDRTVIHQDNQLSILFINLSSQSQIASTEETYLKNLRFEGIEGDWQSFSGTWQLEPMMVAKEEGTPQVLITHQVTIEPGPQFSRQLFFSVYKAILEETLAALKVEIEKRSS